MPASAARKARRANSGADEDVADKGQGQEPFIVKSFDGTEVSFPDAPPKHCKIMFPSRPIWENIMNANYYSRIWTRLPSQADIALEHLLKSYPGMSESFVICHRNVFLVYDAYLHAHKRHYKAIMEMVQSQNIGGDYNKCKFEATRAIDAGFVIEQVNGPNTPGLMIADVADQTRSRGIYRKP